MPSRPDWRAIYGGATPAPESGARSTDERPTIDGRYKVVEQRTGRPVLIDFGLARRRSASNTKLSITGGTPCYMPPEQAMDVDGTRVGPAADLYALGCTAFELLTGRPVFDGATAFAVLS